MAIRVFNSHSLRRSQNQLKILFSNPLAYGRINSGTCTCKVVTHETVLGHKSGFEGVLVNGQRRIHVGRTLLSDKAVASEKIEDVDGNSVKVKRPKLKGKRAVVKWLKSFRWKKKKDFQRMTAEEKILYKLRLAQKKEERLVEALRKIEPKETSETTHDPEILTPEEHFFFLKMGVKCKNYVPVGRRGIYGGVILNMHLHWKKHQTLQVIVKTFTPEEVKEIALELARLTGGIVLGFHEENTIIMYRGKNYSQPPTEIMSPRETLSRKKALDKSKYRDGLRALRKYIPKLQQDLQLLQARAKSKPKSSDIVEETLEIGLESSTDTASSSGFQSRISDGTAGENDDDDVVASGLDSESEDLSDIFECESEMWSEEKAERPLYLEEFEKFPVKSDGALEGFEDHFRRVSMDSSKDLEPSENQDTKSLDEIDRLFLRASSLFKQKKR